MMETLSTMAEDASRSVRLFANKEGIYKRDVAGELLDWGVTAAFDQASWCSIWPQ